MHLFHLYLVYYQLYRVLCPTSRICQRFRARSDKFFYCIAIGAQLELKSSQLKYVHGFAHNKIRKCIYDTLHTSDSLKTYM